MIENILTALGIAMVPSGAGIRAYLNLRDRILKAETVQDAKNEIVLVKLDAIIDKIDLRCDILEHRIERIERKVLNGEYKSGGHQR